MKPFYNKAKTLAEGIIKQRLYLISTDKSFKADNDKIRQKAEILREKLELCKVDKTLASFIIINYDALDNMIPGGNHYQNKSYELKKIRIEAVGIISGNADNIINTKAQCFANLKIYNMSVFSINVS